MQKQFQIFMAFFRIGMLGFGGGPSMIPVVHKEVVERYQWMTDKEFGDVLAIGNTLPGPIATKMAGYIGYRVDGIFGSINATLATIVPSVGLMIAMMTTLSAYKDLDWVVGMSSAVVPVVAVMMATLTWDFFSKSQASLGWFWTISLALISGAFIEILDVHPGFVIGVFLIAALCRPEKKTETLMPSLASKKGGN